MRKIQMVDLHSQYIRLKNEIDTAIQSVLDSANFVKGPETEKFQQELSKYLNCSHVIACANGTDALQIAMMSLGLKPGDEVITPTFTFIATVETIALLGLKPVLVDVDPDTFLINIDEVRKKISENTKAIIPVHLFGQCADLENLELLAKSNNIHIIEDNAQALGSDFIFKNSDRRKSGTIGTIGCTSFFPSKNLGCYGDGGALITNNDEIAKRILAIANHGMIKKYHHEYIGINSRLDAIQAAILRVKLKYLDEFCEKRRNAADFYDERLKHIEGIRVPKRVNNSTHVFHQYTIVLEKYNRDEFADYLNNKGIPAMVYYPVPLHLQNAYKYLGYKYGDFPVAEELANKVISLPMHTELDEEQLNYIANTIYEYVK
jgi:dTDP-4-amino-4,6-dideoxygalactose transaminase